MKSDHYCIDCDDIVYIGYTLSSGITKEQWDNCLCPVCKSNLLIPIVIAKPDVIKKVLRRHKLKRLCIKNYH